MTPATRRSRRVRTFRAGLDPLESRIVLASPTPAALGQLFAERINDARAELGARRPNAPTARPLVYIPEVNAVARNAAGPSPGQIARTKAALGKVARFDPGYSITFVSGGGEADPDSADAIAQGLVRVMQRLARGNRLYGLHTAIGVDVSTEEPFGPELPITRVRLITYRPQGNRATVSGVVMKDADGDGRYDPGEGIGGVTVSVAGRGSTTTTEAGGYTLILPGRGRVSVIASGGALGDSQTREVTLRPKQNARCTFLT